jgi:pantoate--beta-alanine ligase
MIIAKTKEELDTALKKLSLKPGKLALIPTMGNLHEGHLSLIKMAKLHSSKTITTIFVNPLQFGKNEDFNEYPRTIETDIEKLNNQNCDVLFIPKNKNEMFDDKTKPKQIESGELGKELCGKIRPDHFDGVLTVVFRMFYIINPDIAIFGAKDYQQQVLIKSMAKFYFPNLEILTAPIVRSSNGIALSSRNNYLSSQELELASNLFKSLQQSISLYKNGISEQDVIKKGIDFLISKKLTPDYYELRDGFLNKIEKKNYNGKKIFLGSIKIGKTRIIDNIEF